MEMKFGTKPQTPTPKRYSKHVCIKYLYTCNYILCVFYRKAMGPASNDRVPKVPKIGVSPLVKSAKLVSAYT